MSASIKPTKIKLTPAKEPTLGSMIDNLNDLREQKRDLAAKIKVIEAAFDTLQAQIIERLDKEETRKGEGKKASASITEVIVGQFDPDDPAARDKLHAYIKKTGYWQLLENRISATAFREILELKGKVPGLVPFTKRNLNLRSLGSA
jgi:hypothetical protein